MSTPALFLASTTIRWVAINRLSELPQMAEFLSPDSGPLPLNKTDRQAIVFARKISGSLVALAVATDTASESVSTSLTRARHDSLTVAEHYLLDEEVFDVIASQASGISPTALRYARSDADELFDDIFQTALALGATDIHFDGNANGGSVSVRAHGEMLPQPIRELTREQHVTLARSLYLQGDGVQSSDWTPDHYMEASFSRGLAGREFRLRFSQRNSFHSFDFSLRILETGIDAPCRSFTALGFTPWMSAALESSLRKPRGMTLLIGEMNSGKSTTLASCLSWIRDHYPGRRIQTLEHPIEYKIPGVRQSSVSERASKGEGGQLWEAALSSLVRSDANDMMIGEIRDALSAQYAQQLTSTGHRLFSTLHAATPILAIQRIVKYGADPSMLFAAGFINVVVKQHLLQVICQACAIPLRSATHLPRHILDGLRAVAPEPIDDSLGSVRVRGPGCKECGNGVIDRTVAASMLFFDREINRLLVQQKYDEAENLWHAGKAGTAPGAPWTSALSHGLHKVFSGQVCPLDVDSHLGPIDRSLPRLPATLPINLSLAPDDVSA